MSNDECCYIHKNLYPNYIEIWHCETPYCQVTEYHCKDCGMFIMECGCGYNNGISGWSEKRWRKYNKLNRKMK